MAFHSVRFFSCFAPHKRLRNWILDQSESFCFVSVFNGCKVCLQHWLWEQHKSSIPFPAHPSWSLLPTEINGITELASEHMPADHWSKAQTSGLVNTSKLLRWIAALRAPSYCTIGSTHSVVVSYKPPMLVTGVRFHMCAFVSPMSATKQGP